VVDQLTVDDFRAAIGGSFALDDGNGTLLDLELLRAETRPSGAAARDESGRRSPFLVHFRGPVEPLLPQRIYRVEHETTGALEIFLVPLGVGEEGALYEAIFA
jgi:hypothetical protein